MYLVVCELTHVSRDKVIKHFREELLSQEVCGVVYLYRRPHRDTPSVREIPRQNQLVLAV